jgi:hypothetical protein
MAAVQNLLAVSLSLGVATASHAWYGWDNLPNSTFVAFESDLIWSEVEFDPAHGDTNVYLATQFYLTNHGGYFGGQFWSDGSQHMLFSIWDYNDTVKNAGWDQETSPWCERFGGEGEGAHCGLGATFEFGRAYRFRMAFRDQNATGDFWRVTVTDVVAGNETLLGDIYLGAVEGIGRAGTVQPSGCAFQEYFTGGDFISEAGWVGPYIEAEGTGDLFVATSAVPDCDEPSTVTDCIHGAGCGAGRFETAQGHGIEKNCTEGENMWAAGAPRVAGPPPGARPLVQTPTTAMA